MSDTVGHSPDRTMFRPAQTMSGPITVLIIALAPQLFHVLTSLELVISGMGGKNPLQVLADHVVAFGAALRWFGWAITFLPDLIPAAIRALFSWQSSLLSPVLRQDRRRAARRQAALIYSYPLLAIAALNFVLKPRGPQDFVAASR